MSEGKEFSIDDVVEEWKSDCTIDESRLSHEIIRTPSLHAKYLAYFVRFKGQVSKNRAFLGRMGNIKRKYYRGECTKADLAKYEWVQYQGLKPSSAEMNSLLEFDEEMVFWKKEVSNAEAAVQAIEYIMKQLTSRDYTLKTLFEYNKYLNGA